MCDRLGVDVYTRGRSEYSAAKGDLAKGDPIDLTALTITKNSESALEVKYIGEMLNNLLTQDSPRIKDEKETLHEKNLIFTKYLMRKCLQWWFAKVLLETKIDEGLILCDNGLVYFLDLERMKLYSDEQQKPPAFRRWEYGL